MGGLITLLNILDMIECVPLKLVEFTESSIQVH